VVVYISEVDSVGGLYARVYGAGGDPLTDSTLVGAGRFTYARIRPVVDGLSTGGFVVAWHDLELDFSPDVRGQEATSSGAPTGDVFCIKGGSGWQGNPQLAGLGSGRFAVAWDSDKDGNSSGKAGIIARVFGPGSGGGDGCDQKLNAGKPGTSCSQTGMDIWDCAGNCYPRELIDLLLGDGTCDKAPNGIDLNCTEFQFDKGDCK